MKLSFNKRILPNYGRSILVGLLALLLISTLLFYNLGSLTNGLAPIETEQRSQASSIEQIIDNPLFIHEKLAYFGIQSFNLLTTATIRLPSAIIGLTTVILFFLVLKNWYTVRISIMGTFLFATSGWFLHSARIANSDISYGLILALILASSWLHKRIHRRVASILLYISLLVLLYIPGMIWLLFAIIVWQRKAVAKLLNNLSITAQISISVFLFLSIAPLIWAQIQNPSLVNQWLSLPEVWPSLGEFLLAIINVPITIAVAPPPNPVFGIARIPLVDVFTVAMTVLGIYAYSFKAKLDRTRLLFGLGVFGTILVALHVLPLVFLLPIVYIFATGGIALMLQQWLTVFPKNPFARYVGVSILTFVIGLSAFYHLNSYFVAWPNVPETKQVFNQEPIIR
jgi:hypothetical protein